MKIFLFDRIAAGQKVGYDQLRSIVIVAENYTQAHLFIHENVRDEGYRVWINLPYKVLGEAAEGIEAGVVCRDVWEA